MKFFLSFLLLLLPHLSNADTNFSVNKFKDLSINDKLTFLVLSNTIQYERLKLHNEKLEIYNPPKWKNKEIRYLALECEIQELNQNFLKFYEKNKKFLTNGDYSLKVKAIKDKIHYIPNCDEIKKKDEDENWKLIEVFPAPT